MSNEEFWEYVEIEGLEYFLNYKTNDWKQLHDKKLLKWCIKYVKLHNKIISKQPN